MFCKHCGRKIADDSKFCEFCGNLTSASVEDTLPELSAEPIVIEQPSPEPPPAPEVTSVPVAEEAPTRIMPRPEYVPAPTPKEMPKKKKKLSAAAWTAIIGGAVALAIIIGVVIAVSLAPREVELDVAQFVEFEAEGYDGYATLSASIDWTALEREVLGDKPNSSKGSSLKEIEVYNANAAALRGAISLSKKEWSALSVGATVTTKVECKEVELDGIDLFYKNRNPSVEFTLEKEHLLQSSSLNVLKEFVDAEFEGVNGKGSIKIIAKAREKAYTVEKDGIVYEVSVAVEEDTLSLRFKNTINNASAKAVVLDYELDKSEALKNDDEVKMTILGDAADELIAYGIKLEGKDITFKVKDLDTLVTEIASLDEKSLTKWKKDYADKLKKYAEDNWDDCFHGGNATISEFTEITDIKAVQVVLCADEESNALYIVYTAQVADDMILADNMGLPQTFYFALRVAEDMYINAEGKVPSDSIKVLSPSGDKVICAPDAATLTDEIGQELKIVDKK